MIGTITTGTILTHTNKADLAIFQILVLYGGYRPLGSQKLPDKSNHFPLLHLLPLYSQTTHNTRMQCRLAQSHPPYRPRRPDAQWEALLKDHPDRHLVHYLLTGVTQGFRIGFNRQHKCRRATGNMSSAISNPQPVSDFIGTEMQAGRSIGPLSDIPQVQISRFGVIPKQGQPGKWRLILDLSSPHNHSVNDCVASDLCSMRYATVDKAVEQILHLGKNTLLAEIDIQQFWRELLATSLSIASQTAHIAATPQASLTILPSVTDLTCNPPPLRQNNT